MSGQFWGQRTFCLVTGASKGIGRNFAVEFARKFAPGSRLLLLARCEGGLKQTEALILAANPKVTVQIHSVDLGKPDTAEYKAILQQEGGDFELALLVNNAASVKADQLAVDMDDPQEWDRYLSLNLYHVTALTSEFLRRFPTGHRCVVNVTSLCAVEPFKSMGYYCVGKAAREMYFKVLAAENPDLDILSYSPGPVETDMLNTVIETVQCDETKNSFLSLRDKKAFVTLEQTTQKVIDVLASRKYTSGGRLDYYDPL